MIRAYTMDDLDTICRWHPIPEQMFPQTGFYEPNVAAGFLVSTDTAYCFLEPFIANPEVSKEERDVALYAIIGALVAKAKELGYEMALGLTTSPTMLERGLKMGFFPLVGKYDGIGKRL
jgi:hypothetical protein